ncbi:hypothetical protein J6590_017083 [Homalodisca vitripennis]|nr:hypothetical protein J6590_017083 [Homalodisca vitripennis]
MEPDTGAGDKHTIRLESTEGTAQASAATTVQNSPGAAPPPPWQASRRGPQHSGHHKNTAFFIPLDYILRNNFATTTTAWVGRL